MSTCVQLEFRKACKGYSVVARATKTFVQFNVYPVIITKPRLNAQLTTFKNTKNYYITLNMFLKTKKLLLPLVIFFAKREGTRETLAIFVMGNYRIAFLDSSHYNLWWMMAESLSGNLLGFAQRINVIHFKPDNLYGIFVNFFSVQDFFFQFCYRSAFQTWWSVPNYYKIVHSLFNLVFKSSDDICEINCNLFSKFMETKKLNHEMIRIKKSAEILSVQPTWRYHCVIVVLDFGL